MPCAKASTRSAGTPRSWAIPASAARGNPCGPASAIALVGRGNRFQNTWGRGCAGPCRLRGCTTCAIILLVARHPDLGTPAVTGLPRPEEGSDDVYAAGGDR